MTALTLPAESLSAQCVGDCDGGGTVGVNELVLGINIALGQAAVTRCSALDRDGNVRVTVNELVEAVNAALRGCPTTPQPTNTPTATATVTPTATPNATPAAQCRTVYRTFSGYPIDLALPATDPGDTLRFAADLLPSGAQLHETTGHLTWTPANEQLGPFYLPFSATDTASQAAHGEVFFKVTPLDACTIATCDPATGCSADVVGLGNDCCDGPLPDRVAEPQIPCPEGRVVFVGGNLIDGFGRRQNCDLLRFDVSGGQSAPALRLRLAARCLNTDRQVTLRAQLSTRTRPSVFDRTVRVVFTPRPSGFAEGLAIIPISVTGFELEDAEANLRIDLTDNDGATASTALRVILTSAVPEELPDVDGSAPTPPPAPCDAVTALLRVAGGHEGRGYTSRRDMILSQSSN